jgi:hypothetical protein
VLASSSSNCFFWLSGIVLSETHVFDLFLDGHLRVGEHFVRGSIAAITMEPERRLAIATRRTRELRFFASEENGSTQPCEIFATPCPFFELVTVLDGFLARCRAITTCGAC